MNKKIAIVGTAILCLGMVAVSPFAFRRFAQAKTPDSGSSWMTALSDDKPLSLISMPGSHDSGSIHSIADVAGICQDLTIDEQLRAGVRFFDIRLRAANDNLVVCHGYVDQGQTFKQIRASFKSFLEANPGEGLIVSIKREQDDSNSSKSFPILLAEQMAEDSFWDLTNELPHRLGDIRGKAILLRRFSGSEFGVNASDNWADPGEASNANTFSINVASGVLRVQDHYKLNSVEDKKAEFKALVDEAASYNSVVWAAEALLGKEKWFVNYSSGYLVDSFPPTYSLSVAPEMNDYIKTAIQGVSNTGILVLDFVTPELCQRIYEVNAR